MKTRVAVIYGGRSGEHEISLRSAEAVMASLDPEKYEVIPFLISKEGKWSPRPIVPEPGANGDIDVVFPILHGTFGEDGTMQGLLELASLPYVGAGVFSSSASMDKEHMKRLFVQCGLPVGGFTVQRSTHLDADAILREFELPLFVKPANLGSSVGISKAHDRAELETALRFAAKYDRKVIIEQTIAGQELECAVLGNENPMAATPCEILPSREFYDYDDKYLLNTSRVELPARLSPETTEEVKRLAIAAFRAVECSGLARVDFLTDAATGKVYINEINTLPGFTSISMYPKMWEHAGLPFNRLVERLLELAQERYSAQQVLQYSR